VRLAVLDVSSNTMHLVVVDMLAPAEAATKPACLVHKRDGPSHGSCYSFGIGTPTGLTTRSPSAAAGMCCRCGARVPEGTRRTLRCCSDALGHEAGDTKGQQRFQAARRDLASTSANGQEQQLLFGHAVYGMQGVRGSKDLRFGSLVSGHRNTEVSRPDRSPTPSCELRHRLVRQTSS
jgi:hypothetical protein